MEVERMTPERVTVSLSYSEAVVLFDLLHRWEDEGVVQRDALFDDHAERRVLWDLTAATEPIIDEVFSANFGEVVAKARDEVRGSTA